MPGAARDDWGRRTVIRQYSLLEVSPERVAERLVEEFAGDGPLVFTRMVRGESPGTPTRCPRWYRRTVETHLVEKVIKALRARPVSDGGTLWLIVPDDDGVFRETQRVGNFTLACDAQIYLDLLRVGLRGPDQAKALREWEGFGTSNS